MECDRQHVFRFYHRVMLSRLKTTVCRHTAAMVKDLYSVPSCTDIYSFPNQVRRYGILVTAVRDEIICRDFCHRPDCRLKHSGREGQHICLLLIQVGGFTVADTLFEGTLVQFLEFLSCGSVQILYGEELMVA